MGNNDILLKYKPSQEQLPVTKSTAWQKLFGGKRGGGKSATGVGLIIEFAVRYPGNRLFMGRRDLDAFRNTTQVQFEKMLPKELCHVPCPNKTEKLYTITSINPEYPSFVYYGELKDPDSILSGELGAFFIDEAGEVPLVSYSHLGGSLRHVLPTGEIPPYYGLLASNPTPGWLMDFFPVLPTELEIYNLLVEKYGENGFKVRSPEIKDKVIDFDYAFFPLSVENNPHVPAQYIQGLYKMYGHDPILMARFVHGRWDLTMEGLVYQLQKAHRWNPTLEEFQKGRKRLYMPGQPVIVGVDPSNGAGNYAAIFVQVWNNRILVIAEYKQQGGNDDDFIDWLHGQPFANEITDTIVDSALPATTRRLREKGLPARPVGKKDIIAQINALKSKMAISPVTGEATLLLDEAQTPELTKEFGLYMFKPKNPRNLQLNVPEKPVDANNDLLKALEYVVITKWPLSMLSDESEYPAPTQGKMLYVARQRLTEKNKFWASAS